MRLAQLCNRNFIHAVKFEAGEFEENELEERLSSDLASRAAGGGLEQVLPKGAATGRRNYVRAVAFVLEAIGDYWEKGFEIFTTPATCRDFLGDVKDDLRAQLDTLPNLEKMCNLGGGMGMEGVGALVGW
jgi:hypothetical protein